MGLLKNPIFKGGSRKTNNREEFGGGGAAWTVSRFRFKGGGG